MLRSGPGGGRGVTLWHRLLNLLSHLQRKSWTQNRGRAALDHEQHDEQESLDRDPPVNLNPNPDAEHLIASWSDTPEGRDKACRLRNSIPAARLDPAGERRGRQSPRALVMSVKEHPNMVQLHAGLARKPTLHLALTHLRP